MDTALVPSSNRNKHHTISLDPDQISVFVEIVSHETILLELSSDQPTFYTYTQTHMHAYYLGTIVRAA